MLVHARVATVVMFAAGCAHASQQAPSARVPPASNTGSRAASAAPDSTRDYSGEWESGFEQSVFRGCNGTVPSNVWVSLAPSASAGTQWSDNTAAASTRTYYLRVRAILRGPADRRRGGGYGHLGHADYELYVTRVLEVKPPGQPNCVIRR